MKGDIMKLLTFLAAFLMVTLPAAAYQVGQANRTNFGQGPQQPATQQQYRSFSNYNNRNWGKGVQTDVAGSSVAEFEAPAAKPKPAPAVSKKQAAQEPAAKPGAAAPAQAPATAQATAPAAQPANAPAQQATMPADAAAMIQQVQGLVGAMAPQTQAPAAGAKPGNQAGASAMPDISALMGGMMPTQPQPAPVKK